MRQCQNCMNLFFTCPDHYRNHNAYSIDTKSPRKGAVPELDLVNITCKVNILSTITLEKI